MRLAYLHTNNRKLQAPRAWIISIFVLVLFSFSCSNKSANSNNMQKHRTEITANDILGNSDYLAISYGGYRKDTREVQPTIEELKDDMLILSALNIKVLRTYNTHFAQAGNLLEAIRQLNEERDDFEMYVMLGAWIDCKGAFTDSVNHEIEDLEGNTEEIKKAVELQQQYPEIVKIIAVGNEAMVHWATSYFVEPAVILKWVDYLQNLKKEGELPKELWITSSDNFASWGGGGEEYHNEDLEALIKAVDYVSMHTYPMHDTHYNPAFWGLEEGEDSLSKLGQIEAVMQRSLEYAKFQFNSTAKYVRGIAKDKIIHIGETGWATFSNGHFGAEGSHAVDEYKSALYYRAMREWTKEDGLSCFYFEAFDENWKDAGNPGGSENHFGLFTINGEAKYAMWDLVDKGTFEGLTRNGNAIKKTYNGEIEALLKEVEFPPLKPLGEKE